MQRKYENFVRLSGLVVKKPEKKKIERENSRDLEFWVIQLNTDPLGRSRNLETHRLVIEEVLASGIDFKAGSLLSVEGVLETRSYKKDESREYITEVNVRSILDYLSF